MFESFKGRTVEIGQAVEVYRNLNRRRGRCCWSIRDAKTGVVLGHTYGAVKLKQARFVVKQAGRRRAVERRQRVVHAWVTGALAGIGVEVEEGLKTAGYNPFKHERFTDLATGQAVEGPFETVALVEGKTRYA